MAGLKEVQKRERIESQELDACVLREVVAGVSFPVSKKKKGVRVKSTNQKTTSP